MLVAPGSATGHGDDARVTVEPAIVAPGGGIRVEGQEFDREADLELRLDGVSVGMTLATVRTDLAGGFTQIVRVPADLPPAVYAVVARSSDGHDINTNVVVDATAGTGFAVTGDAGLSTGIGVLFGLVVAGVVLWALISRRRSRRSPPPMAGG